MHCRKFYGYTKKYYFSFFFGFVNLQKDLNFKESFEQNIKVNPNITK